MSIFLPHKLFIYCWDAKQSKRLNVHTPTIPEILCVKKCEGNWGLWVLNEILEKTYPENLKEILGAVWELPAK